MAKRNDVKGWAKKRVVDRYNSMPYKYYIFCEGEKTEPQYFDGFKQQIERNPLYKNKIFLKIEGLGDNTIRIVNFAEEYVQNNRLTHNEKIWCVFDKDSFPKENFNNAVNKANQLNINQKKVVYATAWSNQCIEYWFILHFCYYVSDNDRPYYIDCLNEYYKKNDLSKYKKNSENTFEILYKFGNPKKAIEYAKKRLEECHGEAGADKAPATNVHELVEELSQFLPDDIKSNFT